MMSHHINPYSYGPEVLGATPFNTMADAVWSGTESPYGPTFLSADGVLDQASGHQILADLVLLRLLEVGGIALDGGRHTHAWPARSNATRRTPSFSARVRPWCSCRWSRVHTTTR